MRQKRLDYTQLNIGIEERCKNDAPRFKTTEQIQGYTGLIGQERAESALSFGLSVKSAGYNIYIAGLPGSGRTTFAKSFALTRASNEEKPFDWCYVYNFKNPKIPSAMRFDAGVGRDFKYDMEELTELLSIEIPKVFSTEEYEKQKNVIIKQHQEKKDVLVKNMSEAAKGQDFGVKYTTSGIYFMPIIDGETISEEQYDELGEDDKEEISKRSEVMQEKANEIMRSIREIEKATKKDIDDLEYKIGLLAVGHYISALKEKYHKHEGVLAYLEQVQEDVLENIGTFTEMVAESDESIQAIVPWLSKKSDDDNSLKYEVNLLIDNKEAQSAPVVVDFNPTYYNLIGEVEYDNEFGNLTTDFMKIKPGLLHKANGGYLILQTEDVLSNPMSWEALMRVLKTKEIAIESLREQYGGFAVVNLKPQPIPLDIKVILIGSYEYFDILNEHDHDFIKLFKILADFDSEMPFNGKNVGHIVSFIKAYIDSEGLPNMTYAAVDKIMEWSARQAERSDRLTAQLGFVRDLVTESAAWARIQGETALVDDCHVKKAIRERENRVGMYRDKLGEMMEEDYLMIRTEGKEVGRINGLAVLDTGCDVFAKPVCITATAYIGKSGIVNIEKEAEMSGSIHDKGVQVLIGYLGQTYAKNFPLSLSCRVCFEQSYSDIDGDSASSTELYAILSALSGIPIDMQLAVTGSMNQYGEIQAIGGVTYKVEGFFNICKKRGLTGEQGVVIPWSNIRDLTLNDDVVNAVRDGLFHIYPIKAVDEGMELLLGTSASEIHEKVAARLKEFFVKANTEPEHRVTGRRR